METKAFINEKGYIMNKGQEKFLVNLFDMKENNNHGNFKRVVDCLEGGEYAIVKELEKDGYIESSNEFYENNNNNVFDASHKITKKGIDYLLNRKLVCEE